MIWNLLLQILLLQQKLEITKIYRDFDWSLLQLTLIINTTLPLVKILGMRRALPRRDALASIHPYAQALLESSLPLSVAWRIAASLLLPSPQRGYHPYSSPTTLSPTVGASCLLVGASPGARSCYSFEEFIAKTLPYCGSLFPKPWSLALRELL